MISKSRIWLYLVAALVLLNSYKSDKKTEPGQQDAAIEKPLTFTTALGNEFKLTEPSQKLLDQYVEAKKNYDRTQKNTFKTIV